MLIKHHNNITVKELIDFKIDNITNNPKISIMDYNWIEYLRIRDKYFEIDNVFTYDQLKSQSSINGLYRELKKLVKDVNKT